MDMACEPVTVNNRRQSAWASRDDAVIATTLQIVGEQLAEECDIGWDQQVLDVAAGHGNATLAAARRGARVTSTDPVGALLEQGAKRLAAEGLAAAMQVADAQALPFGDASFDKVLSAFGVMFAPDPERAAAELLRVCRSGGCIGLATWTPDSFIGRLFTILGSHVPPPPGIFPPSLWGRKTQLRRLFPGGVSAVMTQRKTFNFRYRSAAHCVEVFRASYGPVNAAFASLRADEAALLEGDLIGLLTAMNVAAAGALTVPSHYLEIVVVKA
jgi:SAM-dependent methyltransferase